MQKTESYIPAPIPEPEQTDTISVAVAVYNTARYMKRCVESLLAQTYRNLEIILVDDGSTDESPALCDAYAAADRRVRVIHKKNGGLASGRNAGIEAATGTYIAFLDNDDWVDADCYERMLSAIRTFHADVAVCRYRQVYDDRVLDESRDLVYFGTLADGLREYIWETPEIEIQNAAWNKLYRRDFLGSLRFDESRWYEDILYTTKLLSKQGMIAVLDHASYNYYCTREGSYMNQGFSPRILTDLIPDFRDRSEYLRGIGREDLAAAADYWFLKRLLIYYTAAERSNLPSGEKRKTLEKLREEILAERPHFDAAYAFPEANPHERQKMELFLRSPRLYSAFMSVNDRIVIPCKQRFLQRRQNRE